MKFPLDICLPFVGESEGGRGSQYWRENGDVWLGVFVVLRISFKVNIFITSLSLPTVTVDEQNIKQTTVNKEIVNCNCNK